jgi:hypothetical protein
MIKTQTKNNKSLTNKATTTDELMQVRNEKE